MVNFGLLTAEISLPVWGTPANFNGLRVMAALLHGTLVVGVSEILRRCTEGATATALSSRKSSRNTSYYDFHRTLKFSILW